MVCGVLLISDKLSLRDEMCGSTEPVDEVSFKSENVGATTDVSEMSTRLVCLSSFKGVEIKGVLFEVDKLESNN